MLEKKNREVRERIVEVARELFMTRGLKGTTVRDIATASGTNVAMVNYYFRSKDKLFEAILEESFGVLVSRVFTAIDSDLPFFDMVRKWVYSYFDTLKENPQLPLFVLTELSQNPTILLEKIRLKDPYHIYARLAIRVHEEEKNGVIKKVPISSFLLSTVSLCVFPFLFRPMANLFIGLPQGDYDDMLEQHKKYVADIIIDALKAE